MAQQCCWSYGKANAVLKPELGCDSTHEHNTEQATELVTVCFRRQLFTADLKVTYLDGDASPS
jgi:hypothetical protein